MDLDPFGDPNNPYDPGNGFSWNYLPSAEHPGETLCTASLQGTTDDGTDVLSQGGLEKLYLFNVTAQTEITFDACESSFDTILSVYALSATLFESSTAPLVTRDDGGCDANGGLFTRTKLSVILDPGCYVFVVEGYSTEQGAYDIVVSCSVNFTAQSASNITCGATRSGNTTGGGVHVPLTSPAAIFPFNISADYQPVSFSACRSGFDVVLSVMDPGLTETFATRDDGGCETGTIMPVLQTQEVGASPPACVVCGRASRQVLLRAGVLTTNFITSPLLPCSCWRGVTPWSCLGTPVRRERMRL